MDEVLESEDKEKIIIRQINLKLLESLKDYRNLMKTMAADAPIGVLGLSHGVERILIKNDLCRVYDLLNTDLTKIEGLGVMQFRHLASRLDEFLSMC